MKLDRGLRLEIGALLGVVGLYLIVLLWSYNRHWGWLPTAALWAVGLWLMLRADKPRLWGGGWTVVDWLLFPVKWILLGIGTGLGYGLGFLACLGMSLGDLSASIERWQDLRKYRRDSLRRKHVTL